MSEQTYSHLLPTVQALADAPNEARIRRIRTDRWLGYARAEAALTALEDLLSFPKRQDDDRREIPAQPPAGI